jgi:polyhydroxyalkanoate synthesis regulator phasin
MTADEIKEVVRDVLNEQKLATQPDLDKVVLKTIATLLTSFGIEEDDRKEVRADFEHLRKWRKSVEQAQGYTFKIVITTIIGGFLGAVWLGFQAMLHR